MLNQMTILKSEKLLARIIAERNEIIEGLVSQIDQLGREADRLRKELHSLKTKKDEGPCGPTSPAPRV